MDDTGLADIQNDLNTGPGTGGTWRPSVLRAHTDSHRRLNSLPRATSLKTSGLRL
jgi:hypothetical protein